MASTKEQRGPTREQLTDKEWIAVCGVFDTLLRIKQRIARDKASAS